MASLLEKQSYRKKISFVKSDNNAHTLAFTINVQCNHDIDKSVLKNIEKNINDMFLKDYTDMEDYLELHKADKENEKLEKQLQKEKEKQQKQMEKQILKKQLENAKKKAKLIKAKTVDPSKPKFIDYMNEN